MIINDLYNNKKQNLAESQLDAGEDPYYFRVRHQTKRDIELEITMPKAWDAVGPAYATYEEAQAALKALQAKYPNERFTYTQHPRISNMGGSPHRAFPLGVAEDDDAVAAFLARGGEVQKLKSAKPRKGERWQGSSHIGAAGGRGTKGRVTGLAANTGKSGKPVVTAEDSSLTHRIGLTVTDPNHPMVSKRGETYQKSVRVTGPDREAAINQAIAHYRRKGYKVHDHHYLGTVDQGMAEASLGDYRKKAMMSKAMAQTNRFFDRDDPAKTAAADQTIANRERGMARADARAKAYTPPAAAPVDLEKQQRDLTAKYPNIDELVRRAELTRDPDYEMADGQAYYAARDAEQNYQKLRQIQRVIQGLNESLGRSHLP
jgi:hypothetical protein